MKSEIHWTSVPNLHQWCKTCWPCNRWIVHFKNGNTCCGFINCTLFLPRATITSRLISPLKFSQGKEGVTAVATRFRNGNSGSRCHCKSRYRPTLHLRYPKNLLTIAPIRKMVWSCIVLPTMYEVEPATGGSFFRRHAHINVCANRLVPHHQQRHRNWSSHHHWSSRLRKGISTITMVC